MVIYFKEFKWNKPIFFIATLLLILLQSDFLNSVPPTIIELYGTSSSGKSSIARVLNKEYNYESLSQDEVENTIFEANPNWNYDSLEVAQRMIQMVEEESRFKNAEAVVLDTVFLPESQNHFLRLIQNKNYKVYTVLVFSSLEKTHLNLLARNQQGDFRFPTLPIHQYMSQFSPQKSDQNEMPLEVLAVESCRTILSSAYEQEDIWQKFYTQDTKEDFINGFLHHFGLDKSSESQVYPLLKCDHIINTSSQTPELATQELIKLIKGADT